MKDKKPIDAKTKYVKCPYCWRKINYLNATIKTWVMCEAYIDDYYYCTSSSPVLNNGLIQKITDKEIFPHEELPADYACPLCNVIITEDVKEAAEFLRTGKLKSIELRLRLFISSIK